jgi:tight adherence protein C
VVTVLLLVLAACTLSASIFVASSALTATGRRRQSAVAVVRRWSAASGPLHGDSSQAKTEGLIQRLGQRLMSDKLADVLPQRLAAAGLAGRVTPQEYVAYRVLLVAGGVFAALLIAASSGQSFGATIMLAGAFGIAGFVVPKLLLGRRLAARRAEISNDLPDALDLLAVTVEAGLGLFGAIARLVECTEGALSDEFSLVLTELRVGESSERALKRMAKRIDTPEVTSFVRSLLQGEQLGLSLGLTLRNLADDSRRRRRSLAEEAAAKAPIKMLFPAALFIFPALFIVILGPAALQLGKYL